MGYRGLYNKRATPQTEPVPGRQMVQNSAGGYGFAVSIWTRLNRFLVLGSDAPTYYASAKKLTMENVAIVNECLDADYQRAIQAIWTVRMENRAPKQDSCLFALALAASHQNVEARRYAFSMLNDIAQTAEQLFQFVSYTDNLRGRGQAFQKAIQNWYLSKDARKVAYQVLKYRQRHDYTHRDMLRIARPDTDSAEMGALFRYVTQGGEDLSYLEAFPGLGQVLAYEAAKTADERVLTQLITDYRLTHEMVPTEALTNPKVWEAMLADMPMRAMVRNLGRMTSLGTLKNGGRAVDDVIERLSTEQIVRHSRLHPLSLLVAMKTYAAGKGERGSLRWTPIPAIVDALDTAFYLSFGNVESTGKRIMLALDISSSMNSPELSGMTGITPRIGSAAMAMVTNAVENRVYTVGFHNDLINLDISSRRRLDDVIAYINRLGFGSTDCSLPMRKALEFGTEIDAFVIYTDSETWSGNIHPFQALQQYRDRTGIPAKLIVVAMTSTGFTIADPNDAGMLDVVGFDTATPNLISHFITGGI